MPLSHDFVVGSVVASTGRQQMEENYIVVIEVRARYGEVNKE